MGVCNSRGGGGGGGWHDGFKKDGVTCKVVTRGQSVGK